MRLAEVSVIAWQEVNLRAVAAELGYSYVIFTYIERWGWGGCWPPSEKIPAISYGLGRYL